jgi:hypothetical protein
MARFQKGVSGNPAGKPRGARDKRTELRALLVPHAERLVKKAVELALAGDTTALRICIDRLLAPVKAKDEAVKVGKVTGTLAEQGRAVLKAMAAGRITPEQASVIMGAVAAQARIVEVDELERRIAALEATKS